MLQSATSKQFKSLGTSTRKSRSLITQAAGRPSSRTSKPKETAGPPARLSKIFKLYESQGLEQQQQELEEYVAEREDRPRHTRATAGSAYIDKDETYDENQRILFRIDERGRRVQDIGGFGRSAPQWWALFVTAGREKQVSDALHRRLPFLPSIEANPSHFESEEERAAVAASERTMETWVPEKKVKAWNPKTNRLGNKLFKYEDGGWVFMNCILDRHLLDYIKRNVNVLGFRHTQRFEGKEYPTPCNPIIMSQVKNWEEDLSDIGEEAMRLHLGLPPMKDPDWEDLQAQNEHKFWEEEAKRKEKEREDRNNRRSGGDRDSRDSRGTTITRAGGMGRAPRDSRDRGTTGTTDRGRTDRDRRSGGGREDRQRTGLYTSSDSGGGTAGGWYEGPSYNTSTGSGSTDDDLATGGWYTAGTVGGSVDGGGSGTDTDAWYETSTSNTPSSTPESGSVDPDSGTVGGGLDNWFEDAAAAYESAAAIGSSGTTSGSSDNTGGISSSWLDDVVGDTPTGTTSTGGTNAGGIGSEDDMWGAATGGGSGTDSYSGLGGYSESRSGERRERRENRKAADIGGSSGSGGGAQQDMWGSGDAGGYSGWLDDFDTTPTSGTSGAPTSYRGGERGEGERRNRFDRGGGDRDRDSPRPSGFDGRGDRREREPRSREKTTDRRDDSRGSSFRDSRGGDRDSNRGDRVERYPPRDRDSFRGGNSRERGDSGGDRGGGYSNSQSSSQWSESGPSQQSGGGDDLSWWDDPDGSNSAAANKTASGAKSGGGGGSMSQDFADIFTDTFDDAPTPSGGDSDRRERKSNYNTAPRDGDYTSSSGDESASSGAALPAGTPIKIVGGPFQDFDGVVIESNSGSGGSGNKGSVKAELDVFGKMTVVDVNVQDISPAE